MDGFAVLAAGTFGATLDQPKRLWVTASIVHKDI